MNDRKLLGLAAAAGALAAAVAFLWLHAARRDLLAFTETKGVVVAKRYLPAWSRIAPDAVELRQVPGNAVQPGSVPDPSHLAGMLAIAPFEAGEQILANKVASAGGQLSAYVPRGMRAWTMSVDALSSHAGLLRPGDGVDVLVSFEVAQTGKSLSVTGTLLQDVRVVAVGARFTNEEEGGPAGGESVTLALAPDEAELLTFAEERGRLRLALRSPGDAARLPRHVVSFKALADRLLGETRD